MTTESTFRAIILANFALCLPNIYYRIKSQATGEKLDRSQEGIAVLVGLRLLGVLAWVALVRNALDAPKPLTESQKRLGSVMRGDERSPVPGLGRGFCFSSLFLVGGSQPHE